MKKIMLSIITIVLTCGNVFGYQILTTKEFGKDDAKNQNIIVKCTTDTGKLSGETCSLRRYVKCDKDKSECISWQPWRDLRHPGKNYPDWKSAASDCCKRKGLR